MLARLLVGDRAPDETLAPGCHGKIVVDPLPETLNARILIRPVQQTYRQKRHPSHLTSNLYLVAL
jgi:hypothetical protein